MVYRSPGNELYDSPFIPQRPIQASVISPLSAIVAKVSLSLISSLLFLSALPWNPGGFFEMNSLYVLRVVIIHVVYNIDIQ